MTQIFVTKPTTLCLLQVLQRGSCRRAGMVAHASASPELDETPAQTRLMDEYVKKAVSEDLGAEYDSVTASRPKHRRAGEFCQPYPTLPLCCVPCTLPGW